MVIIMELLGIWRLKAMNSVDENGVKMLSRDEVAALGDEDLDKLLKSEFILTESELCGYYMPTEEEMALVEEEGLEMTEHGVLIESYGAKIKDGVLLIDYDESGDYFPVPLDEDGCLIISDGMMILEKV